MNMRGPKIRLSRQLGIALTPKAARALERRKNPPGQHGGTKDRLKGSDYKRHLIEKQRLRAQYNIEEKQMRNYVRVAMQKRGNPVDSLIQLLETRLDASCLSRRTCPHNLCGPPGHFPRSYSGQRKTSEHSIAAAGS